MDDFSPYVLLLDLGWISVLLVVGKLLRRFVPVFQKLMVPAPITAGILGLALGPEGLGWIPFSDQLNTYTTMLIAAVFGALPYTMNFSQEVRSGARTMWSVSVSMFLTQWGIFALLGVLLFAPLLSTPEWFGAMVPVGFVGGFGVAAAVGGSLESQGQEAAMTLGFTAATVGTLAAVVGGVIIAKWGSSTGKTSQLPDFSSLSDDIRTGWIGQSSERPSVGKATTNPSSIEPIALHVSVVGITMFVGYQIKLLLESLFPVLSVPLFASSFVVGMLGVGLLHMVKAPHFVDKDLVGSISGGFTDYLVVTGVAAIIPAVVADYALALVLLFLFALAFCCVYAFVVAPRAFKDPWFERALFGWGWSTASVATAIAILKIVDPNMKSGTLEEFGVAYVGFAPIEILVIIIAPMLILGGFTLGLGAATLGAGLIILSLPFIAQWRRRSSADAGASTSG
ncbi:MULTISPECIES: sodium/glutamate symporter [Corynebacterium]|uniref:sodium/glutamate symporter n=1 Tax=Corynebacterium TaxID=1716 RepID=UPI00124DCE9C|nr:MULTISPECIES: sodium:glutamate symporter [Corynebacterium]